ncbi:nuclear transport factor 2 family protein [Dokdonella soli]|uniref:DUF4440 domain-containing protein n=1 Tax=Dokdonella soli TaxID=529810 RepID=A0ABN1IYF7_9GAMM
MEKIAVRCSVAGCVALSLLALPVAAIERADPAPFMHLTQELMDAIPPGRAEVWQRILADDAIVIDEFGRRQDKAEAVKSIHPFPSGFSGSIEIRDPELRLHGDTAVLSGEFFERESVFDQKLLVRYIFSNTFVRRDGDWKLLASIDVTLPTAPPALDVRDLHVDDYPGTYRYGPERAFTVGVEGGKLFYTTKAGGKRVALDAVAKDVFMDGGDERNLLVFRRDAAGHVHELIERRKFNDLHLVRVEASSPH